MPKGPINYSIACVYQICCRDLEITDLYVGSTTDLIKRRCCHKSACTNKSGKNYNLPVYQFIRDHGGWDNWEVVKVQDVDCACREDLLKTERAYMERLGATLNKNVPGRSQGEYYQANKEQKKEYQKDYYEVNKEQLKAYQKDYQEVHREQLKTYQKDYYEVNKEQLKAYQKVNKEKISEYQKVYRKEHRVEMAKKANEKVTCICGSVVNNSSITRHCKSKKHQAYLESLE